MTLFTSFRKKLALGLVYCLISANTHAALTSIAQVPLVNSATATVLPNIFFVLDNSGSMAWNYLPDWANSSNSALFANAVYNGVYYDPAVVYTPPVVYTSTGAIDTTTYPKMTSANTAAFTAVPDDGYGVQASTTSNLVGNAFYYTFIPGEYCQKPDLRTCNAQSSPTASYPYPATLRWCTNSAQTQCQAARIDSGTTTYQTARIPGTVITAAVSAKTPNTTVGSGTASTSITGITVNGAQIMNAATASTTNTSTMATNIANAINACTAAITGACTVAGFSATSGSGKVQIIAPASMGNITYTPVVTRSVTTNALSFAPGAFSGGVTGVTVPGSNNLVNIVSTTLTYPYPGSSTKASSRTDCVGTTCTYLEEMTNYANWWAYYQTRMQMMKTSASIAFAPIGSTYRVGFYAIHNNTGTDFLNVSDFTTTQKNAWYGRMFASIPNNATPLRTALSTAGRMYAGQLNGTTLNGSTVVDPMQYSCQQNFTILSTDGYWNEPDPGGYQLDGTTAVGNQDGYAQRPQLDGTVGATSTTTTTITTTTPTTTTTSAPTTKVVRTQAVTPDTTTTPWSRTLTSVSSTANCNPGSSATCLQDNGVNSAGSTRTWCMEPNSSNGTQCSSVGSGGSAFVCRGSGSATNVPTGGTGCVTDGGGQKWCLFANNTTTGTSSCSPVLSGNSVYVCKVTAGYTVTTLSQTYNQITRTATTNVVDTTTNDVIGTTTTTNDITTEVIVVTNGVTMSDTITPSSSVVGPTAIPSTATSTASPVSTTTATISDTGAPTAMTTWTNGSTVTSCVPLGSLPFPAGSSNNASTPTSGAPSDVFGATTTTTLSTVGPTTGMYSTVTSVGAPTSTTTSTTTTNAGSGGTPNTLADVAQYYYVTDLRTTALGNCTGSPVAPATTGNDVCRNNVPISGVDTASWQHMTTFTLGLGANGFMQYLPNYLNATSGDYFDVKNGTTANPSAGVCTWQASGACNWPVPVSNTQTTIDDLWHAAVNGRGQYFSATNPSTLTSALQTALATVTAVTGTSAAATTSNPNVTSGDNFVFSSTFTTNEWDGQLVRQQLSLTTGVVSNTIDWSAQAQLDATTFSSRVIYTRDSSTANGFKAFTWGNLTAAQQAYFQTPNVSGLSQFCLIGPSCLSASNQTSAQGQPLVDFLRGDRSNEGVASDTSTYYRARVHVLGDIVNAEAVYVKGSLLSYADTGFAAFATSNATRQGMVYIAANDGMLHAFNASTGAESWAYIPTFVLPNLYKLADKNYTGQHQYYIDGTPVAADVYFGSAWHTIVVGGQAGGGRGYFALDVTDPANPKSLWEFTDTNMGLTFGNPEITKLKDGTWVVLVTSGYNNVSTGDGVGRLYVLNAQTGAVIRTISTGVGTTTTPSNLGKIRAWVDNASVDNTALRVYGGDMLGNVWRFDVNGDVGAPG
jgi:type IV pilus assembly protein PilY1